MNNSSVLPPLSSPCGHPGYIYCHVAFWVWRIVPLVLIALGTVGNVLSLAVLTRKHMRQTSASPYLTCLAVSDLGFLWTSALRNMLLRVASVDLKTLSQFNCKFHEFLAGWSLGVSVWMLVLLTKDRLVFTLFPLFARRHMTRRYSVLWTVPVVVAAFLISLHYVIGNTLQERIVQTTDPDGALKTIVQIVCGPSTPEYKVFLSGSWIYMLMSLYNLIPLFIIASGNLGIMVKILHRGRQLQRLGLQHQTRNLDSVTKVLFVLSSVFFVTMTPYCLFSIAFSRLHSTLTKFAFSKFQLGHAIVFNLVYCNFTSNVYLYCMTGTAFRSELKKLLKDMQGRVRKFCHRRVGPADTTQTIQEDVN